MQTDHIFNLETVENVKLYRWHFLPIYDQYFLEEEMASNDEIEEELAAIEAILIDGLKIERRLEDDRPISVTFQVMSSKRRHLVKHLRTS